MEHITIDGIERPQVPVKDWGTAPIDLKDSGITAVASITQIHHKSDGAVDDSPSLAFVVRVHHTELSFVAEITLYTLQDALSKLGYEITPTT